MKNYQKGKASTREVAENASQPERLLTEQEVAGLIGKSHSWVRQQKALRGNKKPHTLQIDPVYVGNSPRYREGDVCAWLETLGNSKKTVEDFLWRT